MRCSNCGICCQQTMMMLSNADVTRLEKAGYDKNKFSRRDKHGFLILKNRRGLCFFYDSEKRGCGIYKLRPLGCRIYPVICSEQDGIIIDNLCPQKNTVSKPELRKKGKKVTKLLLTIDNEAFLRKKSGESVCQ